MRRPLVMGNWKMHGTRASVRQLLQDIARAGEQLPAEVAVCPAYVHLQQALQLCEGTTVSVGAQDCSHMTAGAFTGEVSAEMLLDLGCRWVILGHSERRQYHGESDDLVAAKLAAALQAGLQPVVCVGETREEREAGEAEYIVSRQLRGALQGQAGWWLPTSRYGRLALASRHRQRRPRTCTRSFVRSWATLPGQIRAPCAFSTAAVSRPRMRQSCLGSRISTAPWLAGHHWMPMNSGKSSTPRVRGAKRAN